MHSSLENLSGYDNGMVLMTNSSVDSDFSSWSVTSDWFAQSLVCLWMYHLAGSHNGQIRQHGMRSIMSSKASGRSWASPEIPFCQGYMLCQDINHLWCVSFPSLWQPSGENQLKGDNDYFSSQFWRVCPWLLYFHLSTRILLQSPSLNKDHRRMVS